jgi:DNA adenine methylase
MSSITPFVKWVGGKTSLIKQLNKHTPNNFTTYHEPFVGGGAFFLNLKASKAVINDINKDLMTAYIVIKNTPHELISKLRELKKDYLERDLKAKKEMYYHLRKEFNTGKLDNITLSAYFIFLNKTCFNGIYRENFKGHFNVPFGNRKNPEVYNKNNILKISSILQNTTITNLSYELALKKTRKNDFVYLDPPYLSSKSKKNFTKYHKSGFIKQDHVQLKDEVDKLNKKGVYFLMSNSNNKIIRSMFSKYNIVTVKVSRNISCKSESRGVVREFLIKNY